VEEDDDGAAADELELEADGEEAEDAEPAADFDDELEQPVRERAAATTATAAVVEEGRYLTMTPSVSGCGNGETSCSQSPRSAPLHGTDGSGASDLGNTGQSLDFGGVRP
jgi:hypothetical protein